MTTNRKSAARRLQHLTGIPYRQALEIIKEATDGSREVPAPHRWETRPLTGREDWTRLAAHVSSIPVWGSALEVDGATESADPDDLYLLSNDLLPVHGSVHRRLNVLYVPDDHVALAERWRESQFAASRTAFERDKRLVERELKSSGLDLPGAVVYDFARTIKVTWTDGAMPPRVMDFLVERLDVQPISTPGKNWTASTANGVSLLLRHLRRPPHLGAPVDVEWGGKALIRSE